MLFLCLNISQYIYIYLPRCNQMFVHMDTYTASFYSVTPSLPPSLSPFLLPLPSSPPSISLFLLPRICGRSHRRDARASLTSHKDRRKVSRRHFTCVSRPPQTSSGMPHDVVSDVAPYRRLTLRLVFSASSLIYLFLLCLFAGFLF